MKLSDLGRGAHLQVRKVGSEWRATLRINTDHRGSGVQATSVDAHPAVAIIGCVDNAAGAAAAIGCDVMPGTSEALAVTRRLANASALGSLAGMAGEFEDPTLRQLAGTLARAADGRGVSGEPITLIGDIGWRGGARRASFGARRPFVQRYARGRRRPARHAPMHPHRYPYPHPYPSSQVSPWAPAYGPTYPADGDDGQDPGAPATDPGDGPAPAQDTPTPAAPQRGKHRHGADSTAPDGFDVQDIILQQMRAMQPGAPASAPGVQGEMGWNPFHAISNAVHKAIHMVAHPPTWMQVVFPVLSPAAQKFAAEHVLGKQGDKLFAAYQGAMDAAASGHLGAQDLLKAVPQIAQVAQAARTATATGGSAVQAVQDLANATAQAGGAPDLNALASQATAAASQAEGAVDAVENLASMMGEWSPSPFYTHPMHPSWGLPTRRPISYSGAYDRIYGPQPGWFKFPGPF